MKIKTISMLTLSCLLACTNLNVYAEDVINNSGYQNVDAQQVAEGDIDINETNFPDPNFREYMKDEWDIDNDNKINKSLADNLSYISVSNREIKSLKGIEFFPNLQQILCDSNQIEYLDLSMNPNLDFLYCRDNRIRSLDLSHNPKLATLYCSNNELTELDLSHNPELLVASFGGNQITSIDLTKCKKLQELGCSEMNITELNISGLTDLQKISLYDTALTHLDVSSNTNLVHLSIGLSKLSNIDLSHNLKLKELFLDENQLNTLYLGNNTELTNLTCYTNHLPYLDLSNNTKLNILYTSPQDISVESYKRNGKWIVDLSNYIPQEYLSRVSIESKECNYNPVSGVVELPSNEISSFDYTFKCIDKTFEYDEQEMYVVANINFVDGTEFPFKDVFLKDWFYESVKYVYDNRLMTGLNETTFGPYENLARAQFAVILHRMNGSPDIEYTNKFPDVADNQWYTDAILWASDIGVVTGYEDTGKFGPGDNINREQMAVMMYRYANYLGYDTSARADISKYTDAGNVNEFAKEAMSWAVGEGIITGKYNETQLDPQGNASRAECATIIMRFMEYYK